MSRSARGHIFLCGPGDKTKIVARVWTDAFIAGAYGPFIAKMDDDITLGTINPTILRPVVYSRTRHLRTQTPYTFKLISAAAKTKPTWLRSRGSAP